MIVTKYQATEAHYEFVRSVHHSAYREVVELQYGRWDEVEAGRLFYAEWVADAHEIILCDAIECGYCRVEYMNDHILVRELVVDPRFQGRGIGTRIMQGVIDEASARGVPVRLQTQLVNRAANLYRRLGFRECDRTSTHLHMEWRPV